MTLPLRRPALIAVIIAASWLGHLKGLAAPMLDYHYHRQCNTAAIARNFHENGLRFFSPQIDWEGPYRGAAATEFPLYMWLMGLLWPAGGLGEIWGRLLSCAFSAAAAVYLFLFLERRLKNDEAFYASLIFCAIPLEVYFGRTVQPEAIALFGAVGAVYHWERSLERGRGPAHWVAAVLLCFLAIAHKLPYALMLAPLAWLAWDKLKAKSLTDWKTLTAPLLTLGLTYAWYRHASAGLYVVPSHPGEFLSMLNYGRLPYFLWFNFFSRFPELSVGWAGMPLFVLGAREVLWRRGDRLLGVWLGAAALTIIASGGYSFHHEYTQLPFIPVTAALMGVGFSLLKERAARRGAAAALALALLAAAIPAYTAIRIKHWYKYDNYAFLENAEKAADAVSAPEDLFIGNERAGSVFLYYLHRRGWSWDLEEQGPEKLAWLEERIGQGAKFYMTRKAGGFSDPENIFRRHFYSRYPVVYDADDILIFRLTPGA